MFRSNFSRTVLAFCFCCAGVLSLVRAWADPATSLGDATIDTAVSSPTGMGLKLPPNLIVEVNTQQAVDSTVTPVPRLAAHVVADKSLVTARHAAANKPRLGRELGAGVASWYGSGLQGRRTASGERFDRYALTAAHKTLPLGTRVVVSNPRNGKQIVVRINDRGPYTGNRALDLSEAAAHALGLKARGHDWVVMNAVLPPAIAPDAVADKPQARQTASWTATQDAAPSGQRPS